MVEGNINNIVRRTNCCTRHFPLFSKMQLNSAANRILVRTVKYINRRGIGNNAAPWINKSLDRFVLEAAAKRHVHGFVIPPLHFLNEILESGHSPPFEWKPFVIDEMEYQQIVEHLTTDTALNVVTDNEFDNAKSLWDWKVKMGKKYKHSKNRR